MNKFEEDHFSEGENQIEKLLRNVGESPKSQVGELLDDVNKFEEDRELFVEEWLKTNTSGLDSNKAMNILSEHASLYYVMQEENQSETSLSKEEIINKYEKLLNYIDLAKFFFKKDSYQMEESFFEQLEYLKKSVEFYLEKVNNYSGEINDQISKSMHMFLVQKWQTLFKFFTHLYQNNLFDYEKETFFTLPQQMEVDIKREVHNRDR